MKPPTSNERPVGVYLVALYFVSTGFMESIHKYRQWGSEVTWSPFGEHSIWQLGTDILIYSSIAYLVWRLCWLGRLAALVFAYLYLATCVWALALHLGGTPMNTSPLFFGLAVFHIVVLPLLLYYLQSRKRKEIFRATLTEILLPND